jgi:hypothetical protein
MGSKQAPAGVSLDVVSDKPALAKKKVHDHKTTHEDQRRIKAAIIEIRMSIN